MRQQVVEVDVGQHFQGDLWLKSSRFLNCAKMVDNTLIIMMQDPLHVGKKLQNPLLLATKIVFWGKHMASKNNLLLILEKINKDQHGLLEEDINVKDKQNFPTEQQIAFPKVRKCLETIDESIVYEGMQFQEHVKGTILHLQIIWAFLEVFYGQGILLE